MMGATLTEALLAPSTIRVYGRVFTGLEIGDLGLGASSTNPLVQRLSQAAALKKAAEEAKAKNVMAAATDAEKIEARKAKLDMLDSDLFLLARIYGFSYLGNYFK